MARKQTFQQRLVAFAITATDDELNAALDTLKAFKDAKAPKSTRAKRSDAGSKRGSKQMELPLGEAKAAGE